MRIADWNKIDEEEKRNLHWKHHPRTRIASLFSIIFVIVFVVVMMRIFQNRRVHVNRKPNAKEAFTVAKVFIKDKLKQPATASFARNKFESNIDTAHNSYQISSYVEAQDSSGHLLKTPWQIKMAYKGGDWADRKSWSVTNIMMDGVAPK